MTPLSEQIANLMHPLDRFYQSAGQAAPEVKRIEGADMPQPYRRLLVHESDMTPTLEKHFAQTIAIQPMSVQLDDEGTLLRQVVLEAGPKRRPVEFGAIRIHVNRFTESARSDILKCRKPLGTIMAEQDVPHRSSPSGYFEISGDDPVLRAAFDLTDAPTLYGRHNILRNPDGEPLAEVVEILPPLDEENGSK